MRAFASPAVRIAERTIFTHRLRQFGIPLNLLNEREAREFADAQGYKVDWDSVERLDDQSLINGVSQIAPFDPASKQALLEANTLSDRCELLVQLMQFFGRGDGTEEIMTLQ